MEVQFECVYVDSIEIYRQIYARIMRKNVAILTVIWLVMTLVMVYLWVLWSEWTFGVLVVLYALMTLRNLYAPRLRARKAFKKRMEYYEGAIPPTTVQFGDEIRFVDSDHTSVIQYSKIRRIFVMEDCVGLELKSVRGVHFFAKQGFTKGSFQELMIFLRKKCPDAKISAWQE